MQPTPLTPTPHTSIQPVPFHPTNSGPPNPSPIHQGLSAQAPLLQPHARAERGWPCLLCRLQAVTLLLTRQPPSSCPAWLWRALRAAGRQERCRLSRLPSPPLQGRRPSWAELQAPWHSKRRPSGLKSGPQGRWSPGWSLGRLGASGLPLWAFPARGHMGRP